MSARPVACSGALVRDPEARLLLVKRGQAPSRYTWSLPGGRVEPGESAEQACVREVLEETGLMVDVVRHVGRVSREGAAGSTYVIDDFECRVVGGELQAASDATDARWVTDDELRALPLSPLLWQTLVGWGEVR
ncbi:MAG: NUDIX hydrolase [Actinomycetota bacterium]|nr:NUDIX hydrolase [Actinomycetota bacterium]